VAGVLQDMEAICRSHGSVFEWKLKHSPQYYWDTHCSAVFMTDPLGMKLIDRIGVDRALWSADYPHMESTWGYSWQAKADIIDALGFDNAQKIVSTNAIKLFKL
jgi:predicted TIM-barrel fold metal-dependent hydrolase